MICYDKALVHHPVARPYWEQVACLKCACKPKTRLLAPPQKTCELRMNRRSSSPFIQRISLRTALMAAGLGTSAPKHAYSSNPDVTFMRKGEEDEEKKKKKEEKKEKMIKEEQKKKKKKKMKKEDTSLWQQKHATLSAPPPFLPLMFLFLFIYLLTQPRTASCGPTWKKIFSWRLEAWMRWCTNWYRRNRRVRSPGSVYLAWQAEGEGEGEEGERQDGGGYTKEQWVKQGEGKKRKRGSCEKHTRRKGVIQKNNGSNKQIEVRKKKGKKRQL
jgi:hypothetical protein